VIIAVKIVSLDVFLFFPFHRILSGIPAGSFGRWAFGVMILTHLVAYNEAGSVCTLVAVLITTLNALLMGR